MTDGELDAKRHELIAGLQEDLAREYKAIIQYVIYSQVFDGAEYMPIAKELEAHAHEELDHAIAIAKQLDYFGAYPTEKPKPIEVPRDAEGMLWADLRAEDETVAHPASAGYWRVCAGRDPAGDHQAGAGSPNRAGGRSGSGGRSAKPNVGHFRDCQPNDSGAESGSLAAPGLALVSSYSTVKTSYIPIMECGVPSCRGSGTQQVNP
jgi:hypothetical protein